MASHAGNNSADKIRPASGWLGFAALMIGMATQGLTFTAFTPALAAMAKDFDAHGNGIMVAQQSVTIASAGLIVGSFLSGKIVELFSARWTMFASVLSFGIFGAGGLILHDAWAFLASRIVLGFAVACLTTACFATIASTYDGNARARVIGISSTVNCGMCVIGLLAGGYLAQTFGWRAAFIQYPVLAILSFLLVFAGDWGKTAASAATLVPGGQTGASLWSLYLLAVFLAMVMFLGTAQLAFVLPQDGATTADISMIMGAMTLTAASLGMGFGAIERRLGLYGTLAAGLLCGASGMVLVGVTHFVLGAAAGSVLIGAFAGIVIPYIYHVVTLRSPPETRTRDIGILGAFNYAGALLNPFVFAPIGAKFGLHGTFLIVGIFMGLMALGASLLRAPAILPVQTTRATK